MTKPTEAPAVASLLTVPQVAERLSVSRRYIYLLMDREELGYVELPRRPGARWSGRRISEAHLAAFLQRNEQPAAAPAAP